MLQLQPRYGTISTGVRGRWRRQSGHFLREGEAKLTGRGRIEVEGGCGRVGEVMAARHIKVQRWSDGEFGKRHGQGFAGGWRELDGIVGSEARGVIEGCDGADGDWRGCLRGAGVVLPSMLVEWNGVGDERSLPVFHDQRRCDRGRDPGMAVEGLVMWSAWKRLTC